MSAPPADALWSATGRLDAPLELRALRRALGQFATGVTIVTCLDEAGEPVGMTANSFASVSLEPPLVLWSLDRSARSFGAFATADRTAFSVLAKDQVELSNRFAQPGADKFASVDWRPGLGGVPLMPGAAAEFECVAHAAYEGGDHLILVGRVVRFARHDERPLVFCQGRYGMVAPHPLATAPPSERAPAAGGHPYDDFLIPLLMRAYDHLFRAFAPNLAAEDATRGQLRILSNLSANGPTGEAALLTRTSLSASSFEEAREALLAAGLIERQESAYAITGTGQDKLADLLAQASERERQSTAALEPGEVEMLRALLRKLVLASDRTGR